MQEEGAGIAGAASVPLSRGIRMSREIKRKMVLHRHENRAHVFSLTDVQERRHDVGSFVSVAGVLNRFRVMGNAHMPTCV